MVYDSNQVYVHLGDHLLVHEESFFTVDTRQAGWGELNVKIESCKDRQLVPIKVDERGNGIYKISFVPETVGKYLVFITFNQQSIKGSPFVLFADINDENGFVGGPTSTIPTDRHSKHFQEQLCSNGGKGFNVSGDGLRFAQVGQIASFELNGNFNLKQIVLDIKDGAFRDIPYRITKKDDQLFSVEFKPTHIGLYLIHIAMDRMAIPESPFKCFVYDVNKVIVRQPPKGISVYQEVQYESKFILMIFYVCFYTKIFYIFKLILLNLESETCKYSSITEQCHAK